MDRPRSYSSQFPLKRSYLQGDCRIPLFYRTIQECLSEQAESRGDDVAVIFRQPDTPRQSITFSQLDLISGQLANIFLLQGLRVGDRVGIFAPNSIQWILADVALIKIGVIPLRLNTSLQTNDLLYLLNKMQCKGLVIDSSSHATYHHLLHQILGEDVLKSSCSNQSHHQKITADGAAAGTGEPQALPIRVSQAKFLTHIFSIQCDSGRFGESKKPKPDEPCLPVRELSGVISLDRYLDELLEETEAAAADAATTADTIITSRSSIAVSPDDILSLFLTSGSTGYPKACASTHLSYVNAMLYLHQVLACGEIRSPQGSSDAAAGGEATPDRFFSDRPLSHAGGAFGEYMCLVNGTTLVLLRPEITVANRQSDFVAKVLEEERCTTGMFFGYLLHDLMHNTDLSKFNLSSLRSGELGGQIISEKLVERTQEIIPGAANIYGTTEALIAICQKPNTSNYYRAKFVGTASPHTEAAIMDDNGLVLPLNTPGEICYRGYSVFPFYWADPEKTQKAKTPTGWYRSGDQGYMNEEGYVTIVGRKVEMIIRGSMNIYPSQIEEKMLEKNKDVYAVQVIGVPDERLGEEICACVVPSTQDVTAEKLTAHYANNVIKGPDGLDMAPRYIVVVKTFPKTSSGKTDKNALRLLAIRQLGLSNMSSTLPL